MPSESPSHPGSAPSPAGAPSSRRARWQLPLGAGLATTVVVALFAHQGWLGGDLPGVLLRVEAFRRGHYVRLPQWFGGVPNLTYSVLLAPLGAVFGVAALAALSAGSTVAGVTRLSMAAPPARRWAAIGAATLAALATVCVGRITYSTGTGFGVWAVVLLTTTERHTPSHHRRVAGAAVLALLTGLSSPVAALFLAMIIAAHLLPQRRWALAAGLGALTLGPAGVVNMIYAADGGLALGWQAGLAIAGLYAAFVFGTRSRTIRLTAALGVLATAAVTAVDTQVTYIVKRLPETFGGATAAVNGRRWAAVLVVAMGGWNVLSIRTGIVEGGHAERTGAAFVPLVQALDDLPPLQPGMVVEVVPTALHWETWHVAAQVPIARGWERQADIDRGALFYSGDPITAEAYLEWLHTQHVQYVALSTLEVDAAGRAEADVLRDPPDALREVFRGDGWTIWEVRGG